MKLPKLPKPFTLALVVAVLVEISLIAGAVTIIVHYAQKYW